MLASVALQTSSGSRRIVAIQLDQVEGVEEGIVVSAVMLNETSRSCRRRPSIFPRLPTQIGDRLHDQREAACKSLPGRLWRVETANVLMGDSAKIHRA